MLWSTEAEDHEKEPVVALAHAESVEGLPGGPGHAGWLVSSSRGCLNLWECYPGSGSGDAALMVRLTSTRLFVVFQEIQNLRSRAHLFLLVHMNAFTSLAAADLGRKWH